MSKKLYRVRVNIDMVCYAENDTEAEKIARAHADEEMYGAEVESSGEVLNMLELPGKWDGGCLPWGDNPEELTIAEIFRRTGET